MPRFALLVFAAVVLGTASAPVWSQTCQPPAPFYQRHEFQGSAQFSPSPFGGACRLTASFNSGATTPATAVAHYRPSTPSPTVRYAFRMDHAGLTVGTSALRVATVLVASSRTSVPLLDGRSDILRIWLKGGSSGPELRFFAACTTTAGNVCIRTVPLAATANLIRLEMVVAAGSAGIVRYWINADFTDPPTGVIEGDAPGSGLNNVAWGGVDVTAIGLGLGSQLFRSSNAGLPLHFDAIEASDDHIFWTGMDYN